MHFLIFEGVIESVFNYEITKGDVTSLCVVSMLWDQNPISIAMEYNFPYMCYIIGNLSKSCLVS